MNTSLTSCQHNLSYHIVYVPDIDECLTTKNLCDIHTCENTPGSYNCRCNNGYKKTLMNKCVGEYISLAATPCRGGLQSLRDCSSRFATATLHIELSIRGLNRNVAILLNMQSRSREATVTLRRRGVAASSE